PAMIFFAVAGPTPGRSSSSFSVARLRSRWPWGAVAADADSFDSFAVDFDDLAELSADLLDELDFSDFDEASDFASLFELDFPAVATFFSLSMFDAETPARDRSSIEEKGRPEMIFAAVAGPTPGSASSSCCVAVLMLTFLDAATAGAASASAPNQSTRIARRL